jgi:response regulator RpfG family c-di-GMP phosphodiesterase
MKNNNGILIFNNAGMDLGLVSALLEAEDCTVYVTSLPLEAIHILRNSNIDVILASSHLDGMEGQEFKDLAEKIRPGVSIFLLPPPVARPEGVNNGATVECTLNLKEFVYFLQNHIRNEKKLVEESSRFKDFFFAFTDRLLQIFEVNDKYFFNNDHLVAELSRRIAVKMGLEERLVDAIHLAALLRDIGKIGIHHAILNGKTRLESGELELVKSHPLNTVQILKQIKFPWNVEFIIRHHHEHYDGNGYPDGLKGRNIPLGSRIISIADSFVAMTTDRAYRKALSETDAAQEIMKLAGSQFDPEMVEVLFAVLRQQMSQDPVRKTLLVLEEDESLAAFLRINLHGDEFDLAMTTSVEEAQAFLEKSKPSLIIADEETLRNDNFRFYTAVRQQQHIPFILIVERNNSNGYLPDALLDYVIKPVDIEDLAQKVRSFCRHEAPRTRIQAADDALRGVSGSLEDMGITDIIQVLNLGMKTAKVILLKGGDRGEIFLKSGKIVCVEYGELVGSEAFFELIGWNSGEFRIFHGQTTDQVNVTMETMTLLLEATKALDERKHTTEPAPAG